jgi:uncharacterized protein YbaP (TraB family)
LSRSAITTAIRTLAALLLLLLAPSASTQSGSTPLLFEVKSATATVYLFGTIHVGARRLYPLGERVEHAFAHSDVLALEADPTDQAALMAAMASGLYAPPDTLGKHIAPELYAELEAVLPGVGLPIEYARNMKPYLLAMTIAMLEVQRQGYDARLGLDMHFAGLAKAAGKRIVELESMAEQIELFASTPPQLQEAMLRLALDGIQDGSLARDLKELVDAWSAGDADTIAESTRREMLELPAPEGELLYERLYHARNRGMARKIEGFLAGGQVCFVAVGAGHLTGATGLPSLLEQKGFAVRRL